MDDSALSALEEAIQRLPDNESDEDSPDDNMTVIDDKDKEEEESNDRRGTAMPHRHYPAVEQQQPSSFGSGGSGGGVDKSPRLTLRRVLDNDKNFAQFRQFLREQCITRNLNFWLACEGYRDSQSDSRIDTANAIYAKFLKGNAPMHVSILSPTKRKIHFALQLGRAEQDLFDGAQEEVLQMMEQNELRQFLCSDAMADNVSQTDSGVHYMPGLQPRFLPAKYGGGSLQSGSDDSASITSYTSAESDQVARTLCVPRSRHNHFNNQSHAHSDTEYSSKTYHPSHPMVQHFNNHKKSLNPSQFYNVLYQRLLAVQNERQAHKKQAANIAREAGKKYEEIMSQEWYDDPEVCKYVKFDGGYIDSPLGRSQSHIVSQAAHEVQEAMKDLDISRQVSRKINSSLHSSSASSYMSDSGVSESWQPNSLLPSDDMGSRVHDYVTRQKKLTSNRSNRDAQAQAAAIMFINSSTHRDDEQYQPPIRHHHNSHMHRQAYSGDDSSSCFTATSQSSSDYFVPRRQPQHFNDSASQQPPRFRRMSHMKRSTGSRFLQQPPSMQQTTCAISPSVSLQHQPPAPPSSTHSSSSSNGSLLVVYTMDGHSAPAPLAKRVSSRNLTLQDFKEKVFARKGSYRFFFKSDCDGLEIMEEISEEADYLPIYNGKIVGHVERIDSTQT